MNADDVLLKDFLIDAGLVGRSQLASLPQSQQKLADALVQNGILGADEVRRATAHAMGLPFVEIDPHDINMEAMLMIPEPFARSQNVLAYDLGERGVEVAVLDLSALQRLEELGLRDRILPRLTSAESMRRSLIHYQKHLREKFGVMLENGEQLAQALISHALYSRAGGAQIDMGQMGALVRYQVGHALTEAMRLPAQAGKQLLGQLKALAGILPAERAQEGRFKIEKDGETTHVHVHSMPTREGESMRIRLARASHGARGYALTSLGLHGEALERVEKSLALERGVIAIEGTGKTTIVRTLEDMLRAPHRLIIEANGPTLRAALKQDPNVVIIDGVADSQTSMLAAEAGERGVLVIAAEAGEEIATRARDTRIVQRLVKKLCTKTFADKIRLSRAQLDTLEPYADFVKVLGALKDEGVVDRDMAWKDVTFARAVACSHCLPADGRGQGKNGGYVGKIGLQEVSDASGVVGLNLVEDGLFKSAQGLTSIEEVLALVV